MNRGRGGVSGAGLGAARDAVLTDEEVAEIVGHVAVNVLTNFPAKAARVQVDLVLPTRADDAA